MKKKNKLTDRDVRLIYLPPAAVAAVHCMGCEPAPELASDALIQTFIKDTNLQTIYPAARHYGFNNPDEPVHGEGHGYERWITIPDDLEVPPPLEKKHFEGGLYAAHMIPMGAWNEWAWLYDWVGNSDEYEFRWASAGEGMRGWLEEHLHYWGWHRFDGDAGKQIDLLIPVKEKR